MKGSTKFFLSLGFVPIILAVFCFVVDIASAVFGCRGSLCPGIQEAGANAPFLFLYGLWTVPFSAVIALLYDFVSDKLNHGEPSPFGKEIVSWQSLPGAFIRNTISVMIILSITLSSIFVVYTWLQERSIVNSDNYSRLQFECTLEAEEQTDRAICSKKNFDMSYCLKVAVAAPDDQNVYYVNRAAFVDCVERGR